MAWGVASESKAGIATLPVTGKSSLALGRSARYDAVMTDKHRLDALEIRLTHQDEVIEDLNKTVIAQWKEIDRLNRQVAMLTDHAANSAPPGGRDPGEEPPPPHW